MIYSALELQKIKEITRRGGEFDTTLDQVRKQSWSFAKNNLDEHFIHFIIILPESRFIKSFTSTLLG